MVLEPSLGVVTNELAEALQAVWGSNEPQAESSCRGAGALPGGLLAR